MKKTLLIISGMVLLLSSTLIAQDQLLVRHSSISPDGNNISFSYQGDIWTVPFNGGEARRLTIHGFN